MTSLLSAYTPLESLLLFQALRSEGVHAVSFNRISEQLKKIPLILNDPTYDSGRLSPDALRELYLRLLKDEVKRDLEQQVDANEDSRHAAVNGDKSPASRKRKAASPSLPTVHEAAQHSHLIPQLVSRLYAGYRENTIRELREHERKYGVLTRELGEIEAGKWDERLQRSRTVRSTQSPKPSSTAHTQPAIARPEIVQPQPTSAVTTPLASASPSRPTETNPNGQHIRFPQATIDGVIDHGRDRSSSPVVRQTTPSSNIALAPIFNIAPKSPGSGVHESAHAPVYVQQQTQYQQQEQPQQAPPLQAQPPQAVAGGYTPSPPPARQSPYSHPLVHPVQQGSVSGSQAQQNVPRLPATSLPILPPPQGVKVQPQATPQPTAAAVEAAPVQIQQQQQPQPQPHQQFALQHRVHAVPSPTNDSQPRGYAPPPIQQAVPGYYQQQQPHPPQTQTQTQTQTQAQVQAQAHAQQVPHQQQTPQPLHRTVYPPPSLPPPQTPTYQGQSAPAGSPMLAPFQLASQASTEVQLPRQQSQQYTQLHQTPTISKPRGAQLVPHIPVAPATGHRNTTQAPWRSISDIVNALATPPRPLVRPLWKSEHRPTPIEVSIEPARPDVEPLSPTTQERPRSPARSTRSTRSRDNRAAAESAAHQELPVKTRSSRRKTNARAGSPHSVVSSVPDETLRARTRSQSVSTAAGAVAGSDDQPESGNKVKPEPSTPAGVLEDPDPTPVPVATPAPGPRTRTRRGTLQAHVPPSSKRKLRDSPEGPEHDAEPASIAPTRKNNMVTATKNFAKVSAAMMNDINSHKHASYFANAVRDKDAPGYSEIVLQPQNLKSIRAAITAGTRAVNAASSALDSPTATPAASTVRPSEGSSTVELERTADLVPPKAIVNSAQLEKELMRMFANAYMFNPGEDGMALITQEMSRDVEQTLYNWRGTEREAAGDDDDEGKGKRRKL